MHSATHTALAGRLADLAQDVIDDAIPFDMATLVRCALDIVKGMAFLHNADPEVVHNDIKPSNILVDSNFGCKVADFGLAGATGVFAGGTPEYMAPELITLGQAGKASDVYAFGIVLWELATRDRVYTEFSAAQIIAKVANDGLRPPAPSGSSCCWKQLMEACWQDDHTLRPSFEEITSALIELSLRFA